MSELISVVDDGGVRTVCLDAPASLNSLGEELTRQLFDAMQAAEADTGVHCVVLTGSGKLFCSGGNLKEFMAVEEPLDEYINLVMKDLYNPLANFLEQMKTPLVTAVNGPAIGAGVGLALNADIVVMARSAFFALPFVPRLAVLPDMGATWLLTRGLGYNRALAYVLTGDKLSAQSAADSGLVWAAVEDDQLAGQVANLARSISLLPMAAIDAAKRALGSATQNTLAEQLEVERSLQTVRFGSASFREGLAAFAEKRDPDFTGLEA